MKMLMKPDANEPKWSDVEKSALPRDAFANQGKPGEKSTWGLPYAWVKGGTKKDAQGIWTNGELIVHAGGLQAAFDDVNGAHTGKPMTGEAADKIRRVHKQVLGTASTHATESFSRTHFALAFCRVADGANGARWYQTLPEPGSYPTPIHLATGTVAGVLVIDDTAYSAVLAAFDAEAQKSDWPGVLVDREHTSEAPDGDTGAVAWAKEIERRADGIWTRWDLTATGEPLVMGRTYAYRSPAMDIAPVDDIARAQLAMAKSGKKGAEKLGVGKWRPVALSSIALTNKPHFDLAPALGREQSQQGDSNMDPTQILAAIRAALGIDDSADMVQAVKKLVSDSASATAQATEAKTALAAVQAKQLDAEADAFVTLHQARIKNADAVKAQFRKDPEATKALFGSLADAPAATTTRQTRVLARADASTPADAAAATAASAQCAQERARVIASIQKDQGCTYRAAYAIAERTRRDLFPARETATA